MNSYGRVTGDVKTHLKKQKKKKMKSENRALRYIYFEAFSNDQLCRVIIHLTVIYRDKASHGKFC